MGIIIGTACIISDIFDVGATVAIGVVIFTGVTTLMGLAAISFSDLSWNQLCIISVWLNQLIISYHML